jgi:hypothetical protein
MEGIEFLKESINVIGIVLKYGIYYVIAPLAVLAFIANMLDESADKKENLRERQ